jgi:aromatic-L-amino-acid/L-tryptophan decarboxylase
VAATTLASMPEDPLSLDSETMRRLGYLTVDRLVERLSDPGGGRALTRASPEEMRARIGGPPPVNGEPFEQVVEQLWRDVLPYTSRCEHPRYFAFIPACGTWPGALGDFIAAALNPYVGAWMEAAGPSQVELEVMGWFADWIGFPAGSAGILVSGGSAANMTALACAREARLGTMSDSAVVYVSDQAHSSVARAARILGFAPHQVRVLPADRSLRLSPRLLAEAIAADARMGRTPLFVNALAGSTNAGLIDPLAEVAEVCAEHGVGCTSTPRTAASPR